MKFAAALLPAVALASGFPASAEPPERSSTLIVYGDDPCPAPREDEIVVCARRPDSERYRIPKELRDTGERPSEVSWGSRIEALEDTSRVNLPGSCSVVGSNGQSGCQKQMIDQWYRERRARR